MIARNTAVNETYEILW